MAVFGLLAGWWLASPSPSNAVGDPPAAFLVRGVGNGHGRGLSQWGAYGRAVNGGQSWTEILDAYYGGTSRGTASAPDFTVRLTDQDDATTVGAISAVGELRWNTDATNYTSLYAVRTGANQFDVFGLASQRSCPGEATLSLPTTVVSRGSTDAEAVRQIQRFLTIFGFNPGPIDGDFGSLTEASMKRFQLSELLPVDGVWSDDDRLKAQALIDARPVAAGWTSVATGVAGPITFSTPRDATTSAPGDVVGVCAADGSVTHYRGTVSMVETGGSLRVVNHLDVENYLRGVVPSEVSGSWGYAGGGAGMNALRAQAVAARSYALAQNRYPYAKTCDTPSCQVYNGSATRTRADLNTVSAVEYPTTDTAIRDTVNTVRVWPNGSVVSTEFSASNGPRTAGGSFPAVDDPLDNVPANKLHTWTRMLSASEIASGYGLSSVAAVATRRDPASKFDGIWANQVVLDSGNVSSAWDFRNKFDLPAPGFELVPVPCIAPTVRTFAMIGDSVGVGVAGTPTSALRAMLGNSFATTSYDVLISRPAQGGAIDDGVAAAGRVPQGTELVVAELGYNDEPAKLSAHIDAVMGQLNARGVARVLWPTLSERRSEFAASNAAIRSAAAKWPTMTVIDWNAASKGGVADRWFSDGVHLTATGNAEFAYWLQRQIAAAAGEGASCGAPGTTTTVACPPCTPSSTTSTVPSTSSTSTPAGGSTTTTTATTSTSTTSTTTASTATTTTNNTTSTTTTANGCSPCGPGTGSSRPALRLQAGQTLQVPVLGRAGVPNKVRNGDNGGAAGVALNVTAVQPEVRGYLRVWECGAAEPDTSSVNYEASGVWPNSVIVPLSGSGVVCVKSLTATDVLVDIAGWFESAVQVANGRLVDTRETPGTSRLAAGQTLRVSVLGRAGMPGLVANPTGRTTDSSPAVPSVPASTVPASNDVAPPSSDPVNSDPVNSDPVNSDPVNSDPVNSVEVSVPSTFVTGAMDATNALTSPRLAVAGVALNVTAVQPSARGYLRVWECDTAEPATSSVNYSPGGAWPNGVIVPLSGSGEVCVKTLVATDVIVDVAGWFDSAVRVATGRLIDTRESQRVQAGAVLQVPVLGRDGVPSAVAANSSGGVAGVALNVTAVQASARGYLRVWECGAAEPDSSSVNYAAGGAWPNAVVVPLSGSGTVCIRTLATTDVLVDLSGWFVSGVKSGSLRLVDTRTDAGLTVS